MANHSGLCCIKSLWTRQNNQNSKDVEHSSQKYSSPTSAYQYSVFTGWMPPSNKQCHPTVYPTDHWLKKYHQNPSIHNFFRQYPAYKHTDRSTDLTAWPRCWRWLLYATMFDWNFPFNALTLLVGWQEGHPTCKKTGCWFDGGDNLTGDLHVL